MPTSLGCPVFAGSRCWLQLVLHLVVFDGVRDCGTLFHAADSQSLHLIERFVFYAQNLALSYRSTLIVHIYGTWYQVCVWCRGVRCLSVPRVRSIRYNIQCWSVSRPWNIVVRGRCYRPLHFSFSFFGFGRSHTPPQRTTTILCDGVYIT